MGQHPELRAPRLGPTSLVIATLDGFVRMVLNTPNDHVTERDAWSLDIFYW
jgi:hypothetical protein